MGLYKPESHLMSPNNKTINAGTENTFSAEINGDFCRAYILHMQNSVTSLSYDGLDELIELPDTLYNGDTLNITIQSNMFNSDELRGNLNMPLSWNITMIGKNRNITGNTTVITDYETTDPNVEQQIDDLKSQKNESTSSMNEYRYEVGKQQDNLNIEILRVQADTTLSEEEREAKLKELRGQLDQINNELQLREAEYEREQQQFDEQIATLEEQLNITIQIKESVLTITNGNFITGDYVYMNYNSDIKKNFYYIRVLDDGTYKLYDTREKSLGGVTSPQYQAVLFDDGVLVGKQISDASKSDNIPFRVINPGTFEIGNIGGSIDKFFYTFKPTYIQENDIPINRFQAFLYDKNKELIKESSVIYSSNVQYYVNNLTTADPYNIYYIRFVAYNNVEYYYDTGLVEFTVKYDLLGLEAPLIVENNCIDSTIKITWDYLFNIPGVLDCLEYVENFMWDGNTGLYICPNHTLLYQYPEILTEPDEDTGISTGSLPIFVWQPSSLDWTGTIYKNYKSTNEDVYISVGYDGECIWIEVNGKRLRTQFLKIEEDVINGGAYVYLIGVYKHQTCVHKFLKSNLPVPPTFNFVSTDNITSTSVSVITDVESATPIVEYVYYINGKEYLKSPNNIVTISDLNSMTNYELYVTARDEDGNIGISDTITFLTNPAKPLIISISKTASTTTTATFYINTDSDLSIFRYKYRYYETDSTSTTTYNIIQTPVFTATDLIYGKEYTCDVQCYDAGANISDLFTFTFTPSKANLSINSVEISDKTPTTVLSTVDYTADSGLNKITYYLDNDVKEIGTQNPYTISGLSSNSLHRLVVIITDNNGDTVQSQLIKFSTLANAPEILSVDITAITNFSVTLNVQTQSDVPINRYEIFINE